MTSMSNEMKKELVVNDNKNEVDVVQLSELMIMDLDPMEYQYFHHRITQVVELLVHISIDRSMSYMIECVQEEFLVNIDEYNIFDRLIEEECLMLLDLNLPILVVFYLMALFLQPKLQIQDQI